MKNFFLISNPNLPFFSLKPFPLVLSLHTLVKRPAPSFLSSLSVTAAVIFGFLVSAPGFSFAAWMYPYSLSIQPPSLYSSHCTLFLTLPSLTGNFTVFPSPVFETTHTSQATHHLTNSLTPFCKSGCIDTYKIYRFEAIFCTETNWHRVTLIQTLLWDGLARSNPSKSLLIPKPCLGTVWRLPDGPGQNPVRDHSNFPKWTVKFQYHLWHC